MPLELIPVLRCHWFLDGLIRLASGTNKKNIRLSFNRFELKGVLKILDECSRSHEKSLFPGAADRKDSPRELIPNLLGGHRSVTRFVSLG